MSEHYRLTDAVVLRDETQAGTAHIGLIWLADRNDSIHAVDELSVRVLTMAQSAATPAQFGRVIQSYFSFRGQRVPDEAVGQLLPGVIASFVEQGWLTPCAAGARSQALVLATPTGPYLPGWSPLSFPLSAQLAVTMQCNLRCRHCGNECEVSIPTDTDLPLSRHEVLFREFHQLGLKNVTLTGGEMTMRKDWEALLTATLPLRFATSIVTNGVILAGLPKKLDFLAEYHRAKKQGFSVSVSLDGATPETYGWMRGGSHFFDRAITTIAELTKRQIPVFVGVTLNQKNREEIRSILELAVHLQVSGLEFHPIELYGRAKDDPELSLTHQQVKEQLLLVESLKDWAKERGLEVNYEVKRMPFLREYLTEHQVDYDTQIFKLFEYPLHAHDAGLIKCAINADGQVYPSEKVFGFDPLSMGSIQNSSLRAVWQSPNWAFFRGGWTPDDLHQCKGCPLFPGCSTWHNRIIPRISLDDPLAAMPECQGVSDETKKEWMA